jgi:DNA-binding beta-propeller fold protein YncE
MRTWSWLPLVLIGCGGGAYDYGGAFTDTTASWTGDDDDSDTDVTTTAPPEIEEDLLLMPPAQTDVFVFVANPDRDTVTRVNVRTLAVDTTPVGTDPRIVLIDAQTLDKDTVDVRANFNDMVLSPDGAYAVLWHNTARERPDDPPAEGLQSYNEASFVRVADGAHFPMAVGFNPRMVRFTPDGRLAVVIADAYLATIDLTVETPSPTLVELVGDLLDPPTAEEVIVARDGSFAWVRQFGAEELLVVNLGAGSVTAVAAGLNPTDLDLSHDGTEAIAVARGSEELWIYDAERPMVAPRVVPMPLGAPYGSLLVDPSGDQGILYTTATPTERYAVWDRATDTIRERPLVKPIQSIGINPTGESLLVFHTQTDGPETEPTFAGEWALTLVALDDLRTNPLLLPAEPTGYANGTTGDWGFFIMEDAPYLEVLDYHTLLHEQFALRSLPTFVGILPDLAPEDGDSPPAWVSQEHVL